MNTTSTYLDGNAAAGPMAELFGFDLTRAVGRCAGCGRSAAMAECRLYCAGPGLVLRCEVCGHVLVRLVEGDDRVWLDLTGVSCLVVERPV